jgi:WD40 repeat protein
VNVGRQPGMPPPEDPSGQGASYRVDIQHGPVVVGAGNTQINASYHTYYHIYQGTWTDGVAPPPLADGTGVMRESPYRGLAAFGEQDSGFFFGRAEAAGQVLERMSERLSRPGLLMVSGVSGAGKSSLLQAGALPRIRESGLADAPEAKNWPCLVLTPGREPLAALASVAARASVDAATTHQALKADPADFALTARQVAEFQPAGTGPPGQAAAGRGRRLLLIVDQFEQLFTQCPDEDQRGAFLTALHAAAAAGRDTDGRPAAVVVLVVRADFEARCADYSLLAEAVQDRYLVTAMTERQLRMVITGPAEKAGSHVDADLVTDLLNDIRSQAPGVAALEPGPGLAAPAGILPLLSHVLDTAWRARTGASLTVADYENAGGIERAVADSARRAYTRLTTAQQAAARTIFLRLTATGPDGTVTADRAARAELLHVKDDAQARDVEAVLEAFAAERLLTLAAGTVEITHEVLLRAWPLLHDEWLAGTQADRIVRTRLRAAAGEWDRSGRDPSYLYAGTLLRDASATMPNAGRTRLPEPSQVEHEFLNASSRARRHATTVRRMAAAALLSLAIGLAAVAVAAHHASQNASHASQNAARQRDDAIASQLITESEAQADANPTASQIESLAAWQIDPTSQSQYALISAATSPLIAVLTGHTGSVSTVAFSPDGQTLAAGDDNVVQLWNVASHQQTGQLTVTDGPDGMAFSPDGRILATGSVLGEQLWDVATRRQIGQLTVTGGVNAVAFSPDGKTLATGSDDGLVQLWNVATRQQIGPPLTVSTVRTVNTVNSVAFSPDGKTLAASCGDGLVHLWDIAAQRPIGQPLTVSGVDSVAFSPDGKTLATGSGDGTVQLWDIAAQRLIGQPFTATDGVDSVAFSPNGKTLAAGSPDGTVRLWDVAPQIGQPLTVSGVDSVAFSPDEKTLAAFSTDATTVRQWNVATRQQIGPPLTVGTATGGANPAAFSPNGRVLAADSSAGRMRLWNVVTRQQIGPPLIVGTAYDGPDPVAFSPDGQTLAIGDDGAVQLWDIATRRQIGPPFTVPTFNPFVDKVAFSPDGQTLAIGGGNGAVQLWDVKSHRQIGKIIGAYSAPDIDYSVAFSPNGQTLAVGSYDGTIRLWDVATQQQIGPALTDTGPIDTVAFSPDGKTLAIGGGNGTVQLWDVATQQQIGPALTDPALTDTGPINSVAFSPDGQTLAAGSTSGIQLWNINAVGHALAQVCGQIGGSVTPSEWRQYVPAGPAYNRVCP